MFKNRREFLLQTGSAGLFTLVGGSVQSGPISASSIFSQSRKQNGNLSFPITSIVQTWTNEESAYLVIMSPKNRGLSYVVQVDGTQSSLPVMIVQSETRKFSDYQIDKIRVNNLRLGLKYRLLVLDNQTGKVVDERFFKAFDRNAKNFRFALISCMNDFYKDACVSAWPPVLQQKPDVVFLIGDTVYSDNDTDSRKDHKGGEANYWKRYCDTRSRLSYFYAKDLIPTLASWDDHDFGANNGNKNFKEKTTTRYLFDLFWQGSSGVGSKSGNTYFGKGDLEGYDKSFGVSFSLQTRLMDFYLMDDRSFRDEHAGQWHWGANQQEWLVTRLAERSNQSMLFNGSQFFGAYLGKESFESDHAANFEDLRRKLSRLSSKVVFGSGDVHFSEIMDIEENFLGYKTVEFTSSSIHSHSFPGHQFRAKNPRRRDSTSKYNFMIFDLSEASQGQTQILSRCISVDGKERFRWEGSI